jgi:hypothetical protein
MCFDIAGATVSPTNLIINFYQAQRQNEYEIY